MKATAHYRRKIGVTVTITDINGGKTTSVEDFISFPLDGLIPGGEIN
jgi:hypothetical protein